ncbi:MAG TPA: hypothetical protein VF529_00380 [Solirubrobacteraceae bacterium]|jgi:hypothetical protein
MRNAGLTALIATLLLALGGGTALAQGTPSSRGYDESLGVIGEIQSEEPTPPSTTEQQPTPPSSPPEQQEGNLPFTGLDLGIVAAMGIALLGTGLVLRRSTRRSPTA